MSCSACARRREGRIVPIVPNKQKPERTEDNTQPTKRGNKLISKLRYTGR